MKKSNSVIFVLIFLLIILLLNLISSEIELTKESNLLEDNPEELTKQIENISKNVQNGSYLKQEWLKLIENNKTLQWFIKKINPFLKAFTGYEFDLSLVFFISLAIAIILFVFISSSIETFYKDPILSIFIGLLITIITNSAGLTKKISPKLADLISIVWWNQIIFWITILGILWIIDYSTSQIKKRRKEKALEELGEAQQGLRGITAGLKSILDSWTHSKSGYDSQKGN